MPRPVLALPCGSKSISRTRFFTAASAVARLTAVVVLPTPPFWLTMARMRGSAASASAAGCSVSAPVSGLISGSSGAVMVCTDHLFQPQHGSGGVRNALVQRRAHLPPFARLGQFLADRLTLQK